MQRPSSGKSTGNRSVGSFFAAHVLVLVGISSSAWLSESPYRFCGEHLHTVKYTNSSSGKEGCNAGCNFIANLQSEDRSRSIPEAY